MYGNSRDIFVQCTNCLLADPGFWPDDDLACMLVDRTNKKLNSPVKFVVWTNDGVVRLLSSPVPNIENSTLCFPAVGDYFDRLISALGLDADRYVVTYNSQRNSYAIEEKD